MPSVPLLTLQVPFLLSSLSLDSYFHFQKQQTLKPLYSDPSMNFSLNFLPCSKIANISSVCLERLRGTNRCSVFFVLFPYFVNVGNQAPGLEHAKATCFITTLHLYPLKIIFMCMDILPASMSMHHTCALVTLEDKRECWIL